MVFRRIPAGLYWVRDGAARAFMENDYYMAMFTVTVGQYAIITNSAAVVDQNDEENLKPKMDITWQQWEGTSNLGYYFPNKASTGPIGQLEQRIHGNAPDTQEWLSMDLPTISMWEVAARAMPANDGSHKSWRWFFGATSDDIDLYAWRYDSTEWYATYKPVGSFLPNDWGFYDIIGNGGQLCLDGIADWPAGDEIYHYSQHPCRRAYSRGAAPYGWMSFWELKEDGERVLHEWGDDEALGYRYSCGGSISDSADLGFFQRLSVVTACSSSDARRGARLAIVCRNEVSAPPVTVTWQDDDGNVIEADAVPFGTMPSYGGATPTKPSTVYGTYEFTGWTPQIGLAVSNTTYTAKFDSHTIYYAIKWLNWDGTELYADSHWYGYSPGYYGPVPTKPPTVEYEYTFTGWSPEPAAVTGETTYVAQFMQSARKYDITWLNYDGSTNATTRTPYNTTPEFVGETPAKPSTVQYAYTFAGWTPELEPATSNTAYTAVFDESIREYPVNFYNNTGSELLFTTNVPYGSTPEYLGETPTKPSTAQYHYSFAGWGRDMMVVDGPSFYNNYYAEFAPILRSYDITWVNYDGTVLCVTNVSYGETPAYNGATPAKPPTVTSLFAFSGWTETLVPVTGKATYTAAYAETPRPYPVTWRNYDGTVLCVTNVPYGEIPAYLGATPKKKASDRCHYDFSGWTPEPAAVTEAGATYTATFNEVVDLLAHLTFDDYGNDGLNVLKATFGEDGIVRTTQANVVEGLGAVTPVTAAAILAGLPEGDGAVAIPCRSHIALPIPAALASASGKPWSISMKVKFPSFGPWYCPLNMPASNSSDAMVYLNNSQTPVICLKQSGNSRVDGSGGFTAGQWETLLFLFNSGRTRVLLNGKEIFNNSCTLAGSRADCANAGGYILLSADNDGDDAFMYWADVRVYDGIVDDTRGLVTHTVTWVNNDGTILKTEDVAEGCMPENDALPSTPSDDPNKYDRFTGWTPSLAPVTSNVTYTATFEATDYRIVNLSELTGDYTAQDGDMLTGITSDNVITISDGATVAFSGIDITGRYLKNFSSSMAVICAGDATIAIADGTVNKLNNSIRIAGTGSTLTFVGKSGELSVQGCIGGTYEGRFGNIVINGGTITTTSAIGGGFGYARVGDITINGGHITVESNDSECIGAARNGSCGKITINGGYVEASCYVERYETSAIGTSANDSYCGDIEINGGTVLAYSKTSTAIGNPRTYFVGCGNITIARGVTKVVASSESAYPIYGIGGELLIAEGLKQTQEGNTLTIEPDVKETAVTVGGAAVGEVVRGEDGKTLSFAVAAGTVVGDVKLDIGGVDVTKGFRVTVNGTEATATLLAPYAVPKEAGAADGIWIENGDGTVTLNVTVVPGLYYAADSAESLDALACPGASTPATGATTLTTPKPAGGTGFFKVWVSDAPIAAEP